MNLTKISSLICYKISGLLSKQRKRRQKKEIWALGENKHPQNVQERLDRSEKILSIRKKYYKEYATFLSQEQVNRVYELEQRQMKQMLQRNKKQAKEQRKKAKKERAKKCPNQHTGIE